jgi:hypothetical protein
MPWSTDAKPEAMRHLLLHIAAGEYTVTDALAFAQADGITPAQMRTALVAAQGILQNQLDKLAALGARLTQLGA